MKLPAAAAVLALSGLATPVLGADCSREDIDHYLDRGFTPQQVLELCRPEPDAAQPDDEISRDDAYWRDVIDGTAIALSDKALSFTRQQCVPYDRPNYAQQRKKACGKVHYRIALAGLEVLESRKKLLYWGRNSIEVRSPDIQRRYELDQHALSERDREMLERELERGEFSEIPIRDGVAVDVVRQRLQRLAR